MAGEKIRVLLLVAEVWRDDSAGGNVINNLFGGMDAEFAQIYCNSLLPDNAVCTRYYRITQRDMLRNLLPRRPVGYELDMRTLDDPAAAAEAAEENNSFDFFRKHRWESFILLRHIISSLSIWKTPALKSFILGFKPDVIFAPCYASPFMLSLTRYVRDLTGKKVVTYSGDDNYSLRQFSLSPLFWLNRFIVRRCLKKTYPYYDLFYSMSEDEIKELSPVVGRELRILRKGFAPVRPAREAPNMPLRLIYAGGLYTGRWKVLARLGAEIGKLNGKDVGMQLHIYSGTPLTCRQRKKLHNGRDIFLRAQVSPAALDELYRQSDVALHCESFSIRKRYVTRLSFSTKITDCLKSGCAVMAVAWKEHTGLKYLKNNGAAICIEKRRDIGPVLKNLLSRPQLIAEYAERAAALGQKNHDINKIQQSVYNDFIRLIQTDEALPAGAADVL